MQKPDKSSEIPVGETESPRSRKAKAEPLKSHITEHKKAEEALEHSKKEWENTFNAISDWVVLMDLKGRILRTNRIGEKFTGLPMDEILWQSCCRLVHGSEKHIPGCPLKKMLKSGRRASAELQVPDTDQWLMVTVDPVTDEEGKIIGAVHITRDITERKKAEQTLRRSEKQASTAIEAARGFTFNYDIATGKVNWGGAIEEITGYTPEEFAEVDIDGWAERIHPDDKDRVLSILQEAIDQEDRATAEYRFKTKKGYVTLSSISITERENGKAVRLVGILQDITERKRAEQEIKNLAKFPSENPNPVLRVTRDGSIIYANQSSEALLRQWGCQVGQLLPDEWRQFASDVFSSGADKETEVEYECCTLSLTFAPVADANYVNVYALDITERKKAEQEMKKSKDLLEKTFLSLDSAILILDSANPPTIVNCNPAATKIFGHAKKELLGKTTEFLHINKKALLEFQSILYPAIEKTGQLSFFEFKMRRNNGQIFPTEHSVLPLKDDNGNRIGWVSVVRDITERKKAEQKIQNYEAKLKAMASETLLIEESERRKIATELHDNVGQKLALAKFDLQSSMRSIPDAATLASLNNLCEEIDNIVEDIRLLTFEISNPVLNELGLTAAIDKYLSEETRQKHRIEVELSSDIGVDNLEGIVRRCLYRNTRELLVNVVKHANAHKVKVRIHRSADQIQICIEDDGIGFDVNKIASLPADTGGFGLFSIREQLEYIGGNLQIESDAGKGTRVTITAPLKS